jgi:Zn-dependent protease/CBS domain-containing protein
MFKHALTLGHVRGIRIDIHASWVVIFVLLVLGMSAGFTQQFPDWTSVEVIATAVVTALVFFASIVAHEFGHSLVAIRRGIPVHSITLFIFGGVAELSRDSESAEDELRIAIAGPLVSAALAAVFGALAWLTSGLYAPLPVALGWLALVNMVVAVFNMIPGFPLDGGRVLRALVWKYTGNARKGVTVAVLGGRLVAYGLFGLALANILLLGNPIGGLWLILIAWFLLGMAQSQGRMFDMKERLSGVSARQLSRTELPLVTAGTSIRAWIDQQVLPYGQRAFLVQDPHSSIGIASFSDACKVPAADWETTTVEQIMTPRARWVWVKPDTPALDVLQLMTTHDVNQIPIMIGDRVTGWINRQKLLTTVELYLAVEPRTAS